MREAFDLQRYFKEGWELLQANLSNMVVVTLIFVVIHFAANLIPFGGVIVSGPMAGGFFYIAMDASRGKGVDVMRIFDGFKLKFVPLVLVGIISTIFIIAGMILFIVPCFLIAGWYLFAYLFVIDKDLDFWPAMEASREIGFDNHVNVFLMALALTMINLAGLLAFVIGVLFTLPLTICVITKAYEHQTGSGSLNAFAPPPPPVPTQPEPPDEPPPPPPPPPVIPS